MTAQELWFSNAWGPRLLRALFWPLSLLYGAGFQIYRWLYRTGLKRAQEPHRPVLCVGNLTVGGSGKSPLTVHLYDILTDMGYEVVVGASGYGSEAQHGAQIAPEGELDSRKWGDEAAMFRWLRPGMKLVVGRDRVLAARLVHATFSGAALLMDDGFQHLPLKSHFSVLLDESTPFNTWCLPAGPYREPRSNRKLANLVLPGAYEVIDEASGLVEAATGSERTLREGAPIQAFCALGRPDRFYGSLKRQGFELRTAKALPDHDPLSAGTLFDGFDPSLPIVVTGKDWVKLRHRPDLEGWDILIARHEVRIEPANSFRELLHATLSQTS